MHISVTGLRLRKIWHTPAFWWHALASMAEAKISTGNIMADARTVDGVHHTLTVWNTRHDMLAYLRSPRHARAMRQFPKIATGRVYGYDADAVPDWDTALELYNHHSREVHRGS